MSREFDTGAVRDDNAGKGRCDLLPWNAIIEVSKWCQKGAEHYGEHNVDKGIPVSCLLDSQVRHTSKIFRGWDDEDHYCANAWNALWALEMKLTKPEMVDVPWNAVEKPKTHCERLIQEHHFNKEDVVRIAQVLCPHFAFEDVEEPKYCNGLCFDCWGVPKSDRGDQNE